MGLAILGRANAMILLAPLACGGLARARGPPLVLVVAAALTVAPWTIRNESCSHAFVPVSTQFGSALAGTYNSEARADKRQPGVVADAEARRRLPADLQPDPQHARAGAREAAARGVDRVHQGRTRRTC